MRVPTYCALPHQLQFTVEQSGQSYHEQPGTDTSVASAQAEFLGNLDQTAGRALSWKALGLVDLAEHGVRWLGDNGSGETGHEARAQVDDGLHSVGSLRFVDALINGFNDLLVDDELGHRVGDPERRRVSVVGIYQALRD